MTAHHLAQVNIARMRAPLEDPVMADFVAALPVLNSLAEHSDGFVWRLVDESGHDATGLRPYGDDVIVNLTVWASVEALRAYAYRSAHLDALRRRREWFTHDGLDQHAACWWIPAGSLPTVEDAQARLQLLTSQGPSADAFTLREPYPAPALPG